MRNNFDKETTISVEENLTEGRINQTLAHNPTLEIRPGVFQDLVTSFFSDLQKLMQCKTSQPRA